MKQKNFFKYLLYGILIVYAVLTLFIHLYGLFTASFKPLKTVSGDLSFIPMDLTTDAYAYILWSSPILVRFINSVIISAIGTTVNIFLNTAMAMH